MAAPAHNPEPSRPPDGGSSSATLEQTPPERSRGLDLSWIQVFAASLAAVTAAFLGSRLGVAGTIVGAGVASVVSTVGVKVYSEFLHRARTYVGTVRTTSTRHPDAADLPADVIVNDVVTDDPVAERAMRSSEEADGAITVQARGPIRLDLKRVLLASLAVFVLAFVIITGIELAKGDALDGGSGTTISQLRGSTPTDQSPTPSSTSPSPASTSGSTSTSGPSSSAPSESGGRSGSATATEPAETGSASGANTTTGSTPIP